jgi:cytidylate kinase
MPAERLQKLLARSGVASRRRAEELVAAGRVTVNGLPASLGARANPGVDRVELDGRPIAPGASQVHLAVHKPLGILSSTRDERGRRSVLSLIGTEMLDEGARLWPAGRLDADSEGLMLLTNDGEWANHVLHPRYGLEREYAVLVDPAPTVAGLRHLSEGVELGDGPARVLGARVAAPPPEVRRLPDEVGIWVRVRIGEGRKREVRRLFAAVGHDVRRLVRIRLGPLTIDGLAAGEWRRLSESEVAALSGASAAPHRATATSAKAAPARRDRRRRLAIAIDGPSGAGKSTVGHALAVRIGANFVDTGLMYRALTLAAVEEGVDPDDGPALGDLARRSSIHVRRPRRDQLDRFETVLLGERDVTRQVRTPRIDRLVSAVSRHAEVRDAMVAVQRATARRGDTVMVGRDIGTVVLPDAHPKVYLSASTVVRARRRAAEMGRPDRADEYLEEIGRRDAADSGRAVAPLRRAPDALVLDTGELSVEECVERIVAGLPGEPAATPATTPPATPPAKGRSRDRRS